MGNYVGLKITFNQDDILEMLIYDNIKENDNASKFLKRLVGKQMFEDNIISEEQFNSLAPKPKKKRHRLDELSFIEYIDKLTLLKNQNNKCNLCGCDITTTDRSLGTHWHIDHIYPLSKGGVYAYFNSQILCSICNIDKSDSLFKVPPTHKEFCETNKLLYTVSSKDYIINFLKENNLLL